MDKISIKLWNETCEEQEKEIERLKNSIREKDSLENEIKNVKKQLEYYKSLTEKMKESKEITSDDLLFMEIGKAYCDNSISKCREMIAKKKKDIEKIRGLISTIKSSFK